MQRISTLYRQLPITKQLTLLVSLIFFIVLLVILITQLCVYMNVRASQEEIPEVFLSRHEEYSLRVNVMMVKELILTLIQSRSAFILSIVNSIKNSKDNPITVSPPIHPTPTTPLPSKLHCIHTTPTTIFPCTSSPYTKILIEQSWQTQSQRPIKRLNLIYQNTKNRSDMMIQSISDSKGVDVRKIDYRVVEGKLARLREDWIGFGEFYGDLYEEQGTDLVSFSTKVGGEGYQILVEMETIGAELTRPLTRVQYSDDTNVAIFAVNDTGQRLVSSFKPLDQSIDFKNLLSPGLKQTTANNITTTSYSTPISFQYSRNTPYHSLSPSQSQSQSQSPYILLIYSNKVNKQIKKTLQQFTSNLHQSLQQISIIFFFLLVIGSGTAILIASYDIGSNVSVCAEVVRSYLRNLGNWRNGASGRGGLGLGLGLVLGFGGFIWSSSLLKLLGSVVREIQWRRKEFWKKSLKVRKDQFPLNWFDTDFQDYQKKRDFERYEQLYRMVRQSSKQLMETKMKEQK